MTETTGRDEAEELVPAEEPALRPEPALALADEAEGWGPEVEPGDAPAALAEVLASGASPEAPAPIPDERRRDPVVMVAAVALVAFLLLGWVALVQVGGLRREVGAVGERVDAVEARLAEGDSQQARAALRRLDAELQGLRETLPPALGAELEAAAEALGRVKAGVDTRP